MSVFLTKFFPLGIFLCSMTRKEEPKKTILLDKQTKTSMESSSWINRINKNINKAFRTNNELNNIFYSSSNLYCLFKGRGSLVLSISASQVSSLILLISAIVLPCFLSQVFNTILLSGTRPATSNSSFYYTSKVSLLAFFLPCLNWRPSTKIINFSSMQPHFWFFHFALYLFFPLLFFSYSSFLHS